jgi:hypothetical protein
MAEKVSGVVNSNVPKRGINGSTEPIGLQTMRVMIQTMNDLNKIVYGKDSAKAKVIVNGGKLQQILEDKNK